eukprot:gb/GECH01003080.1/.p1 GENE.gb/GECH01003080.1/~~gb/GECH01003080.1/.p1  ORF type:complete len:215 (+),score=55.16 gb/GECH01003080.1/:1-645(+)
MGTVGSTLNTYWKQPKLNYEKPISREQIDNLEERINHEKERETIDQIHDSYEAEQERDSAFQQEQDKVPIETEKDLRRRMLQSEGITREELLNEQKLKQADKEELWDRMNVFQRIWINSPCHSDNPPIHCYSLFRKIWKAYETGTRKYERRKKNREEEDIGKYKAMLRRNRRKRGSIIRNERRKLNAEYLLQKARERQQHQRHYQYQRQRSNEQ